MTKRLVGVLAIVAVLAILAYTAFAASQNAVDNSKACQHASQNGKDHTSDNSVLSSCKTSCPSPGIIDIDGNCVCPPDLPGVPPNCKAV